MAEELTSKLAQGDLRGAARWLVLHHGADVLSLCRAMVRDEATAEDLAQDAFGRAFTGLASYRGDASPRTWLMTIARNGCIDHLRRHEARPWSLTDDGDADGVPDEDPLPHALLTNRTLVERGLEALDESQRALVVLRYQHGLGYDELASAFGLKTGTVRMRVSRALSTMRRALESPPASAARARALATPRSAAAPAPRAIPAPGAIAPPARAPQSPWPSSGGSPPDLRGAPGGSPPPSSPPAPASPDVRFGAILRSLEGPLDQGLASRLEVLVQALPSR